MKKNSVFFLLLFMCTMLAPLSLFGNEVRDYNAISNVPILHEGRVKILDTFARVQLLAFYGKQSLPTMGGVEWLMEVLLHPENAHKLEIFRIKNPDVVAALSLERRKSQSYSFYDISQPMMSILDTISELYQKDKKELTPTQSQLLDLYLKMNHYHSLSQSLSFIRPQFQIQSEKIASEFGLKMDHVYSYMEIEPHRQKIEKRVKKLISGDHSKLNDDEKELLRIAYIFHQFFSETSEILRIIPPQWNDEFQDWLSPWASIQTGKGSPKSAAYIALWGDLINHYNEGSVVELNRISDEILSASLNFQSDDISPSRLGLEYKYNKWDLFTKSIIFYIIGFLFLAGSWIGYTKKLALFSFISTSIGFGFHFIGVMLRIIIMERPPVSTLYESIIFVGLIAVIFGLLLERRGKNGLGLLIATVIGSVLHFIGFGYAAEGDTMGMLVAVLNTNFWLATHVVTITIGYGCCFVGGVIGHVYLVRRLIKSDDKSYLTRIYKNMFGVALFALFFALFGTILGGIWADQSWGRFWGWDPKENGALLIVLWLLFLIHGKLAGHVRELGFAFGMVITNIIVALAWFGVNLLNVGLHSYGFTENIAFNLAAFCLAEFIFGIGAYVWILQRRISR